MDTFFKPKSIAVIGASNSPFNLGASICTIIKYFKYECRVYAVNRKGEDVYGCKGYTSILDIPDELDLAIMIVAAEHVPAFTRDCGEKGIRRIIIESAGFSEERGDGDKLQKELDEICRSYGIRYVGPNCLGICNAENKFCCFYGFLPGMYDKAVERQGEISYVIQSGGIGALIIDSFQSDVTNFNKMISIGNKADVDECDMIEYFSKDPGCKVIGLYLESISDGRRFMAAARKTTKPILIFKVGRTSEGSNAARSHTAGLAINDIIFDSACKQAGVIRLKAPGELHTLPKIFTHMPLLKGKRIAIFTNSGAFGGITADLLVSEGFTVPALTPETQNKLTATGKLFNTQNPVDIGPTLTMKTYTDVIEILLKSEEIDGILAVPNVWQDVVITSIIDIIKLCNTYDKPAAIYIPNAIKRIIDIRTKYMIPIFESPEEAVQALAVSCKHHQGLSKKEVAV